MNCPNCQSPDVLENPDYHPGPGYDPHLREFICQEYHCDTIFYAIRKTLITVTDPNQSRSVLHARS